MEALQAFDIGVLYWIADHMRNDFLTPVMIFLTHLCDHGEIWLTLALILLLRPNTRRCGLAILLSMGLGAVLGTYPDLIPLVRIGGYSCPSGHTLASFAASTAIFCFYRKAGIAALLLATLIGFTRLYVGVHYPTDVLFGALLGLLLGAAASSIKNIDSTFSLRADETRKSTGEKV